MADRIPLDAKQIDALDDDDLGRTAHRIAHHYPDDSARRARIIKEIFSRSGDLLEGYNTALTYTDLRIFGGRLGIDPIAAG